MDNKVNVAIVLAGGLGTRLRSEIGETPKALAPVNGKPFLHYLLEYLKKNAIDTVVLSVGFKHELIVDAIGDSFLGMKIIYAIEKEPLGTGGGMKLALEKTNANVLFVVNGDTYFDIDLNEFAKFHFEKKSTCSVALAQLEKVDRYGLVEVNEEDKIIAFKEKQYRDKTIINAGIYCINRGVLIHYPVNTPFSFEKNYLENNPKAKNIFGKVFTNYFVDIGVPEDYQKFAKDIQA